MAEGNEAGHARYSSEEYQGYLHRQRRIVGCVMTVIGFVPIEDEVVETEHIESGHCGHNCHPNAHEGARKS